MNTGQTLLTIGALALLSTAILSFNKTLSRSDINLAQNRYRLEALSILTSYIEQASQYYFDEVSTDTTSGKQLADFTDPAQLGFDNNDNGIIDDFDDFNNYTVVDTGISGIPYQVNFQVEYVELQGNQLVPATSRQYNKKMTIRITDDYPEALIFKYQNGQKIKDTLELSFINTYWFYD